jgi:hypothetical protein
MTPLGINVLIGMGKGRDEGKLAMMMSEVRGGMMIIASNAGGSKK